MTTENDSRPWLLDLGTRQRGRLNGSDSGQVYSDELQMTVRLEEPNILEIDRIDAPPQTKKADIETGEDQK